MNPPGPVCWPPSLCGGSGNSPSLKVQSWLRMAAKDSSFNSAASSAALRSTYTIICFSWGKDTLQRPQTKHATLKIFFEKKKQKKWFSVCQTCSLSWRHCRGMLLLMHSLCNSAFFETCGPKVHETRQWNYVMSASFPGFFFPPWCSLGLLV